MTRDEIFKTVQGVLVEVLAVDEDDVTPEASLVRDLGAESIDFQDTIFRLEQAFGFKIGEGELFPQNVTRDPTYVRDGRVTPQGLEALRARLPHVDFSSFEQDPRLSRVGEIFTVDTLVRFVERKLAA